MQSISPETVYRGIGAWEESLPHVFKLTSRPLILGRSNQTTHLRTKIFNDLNELNVSFFKANLEFDCYYEDLSRISDLFLSNK